MTQESSNGVAREMHSTHNDARRVCCDGGLPSCERCRNSDPNRVTEFPEPSAFPDAEESVLWCIECWAASVADGASGLTKMEATVYGAIQHLGLEIPEASMMVGLGDIGGEELHRRAHDKVTGRVDPENVEPFGAGSFRHIDAPFTARE